MAFFDYDVTYSRKDLYDWVLTEIAVARQLGLTSLSTFLDFFQQSLNQKNLNDGESMWIPSLPTEANIHLVKSRMGRFSRKVLHSVGDEAETLDTGLAFTGQSWKCPVCLEPKAHLKAHLMSAKHQWTESRYNCWKDTTPKNKPQTQTT